MSVQVEGLSFNFGKKPVLKELSFQVAPGEVVGLVGPNGAGKSTVIKLMTRVLKLRSGQVKVDDTDIQDLSRLQLAKRLAVVPQLSALPEAFSVHEIVLMGRTPHVGFFATETPEDLQIVERAMRRTEVWALRNRMAAELSGGERQRVLLARALVQEPRYLLLDEPTNHLDLRFQVEVLRFTKRAAQDGLGALIVMHDLNLAARVCDRVLVMHKGVLVAQGAPAEVLTQELIQDVYGAQTHLFTEPGQAFPVIMPTL